MKKGFTLIELIATIVILALIAMVTMPMINNTIESSRVNSTLQSAKLYISGINSAIVAYSNDTNNINGVHTVNDLSTNYHVKYNGTMPDSGNIYVSNNTIVHYWITLNGYTISDDVVLKTSDSNYNSFKTLSDKLFSITPSSNYYTGTSNGLNTTYSADNGYIVYYFISDGTNVIANKTIGKYKNNVKAYADSAKLLAYLSTNLTNGVHTVSGTVGGVTLSQESTYTVADNTIIDYIFYLSGYTNENGVVKEG